MFVYKFNIMKNLFTALCLLVCFIAQAKIYYFSSSKGNDANPVNSINTPWYSLGKINHIQPLPGDLILFKRGDVWRGTLNTTGNGAQGKPITYGYYGTGALPVISGFTQISGWVNTGNGIYRSNTLAPETDVKCVTLDGKQVGQGRYPNADAANGGYLMLEEGRTANSLTDYQLGSTPVNASWVDGQAQVQIREYRSYLDKCTITSIDEANNIVYFDNTGLFMPIQGAYGYFFTNSVKTLDQKGEWFYNKKDNCLYMYFGTDNPNIHKVKASTVDVLMKPAHSYITVDHIRFDGGNKYGIACNYSGGIKGLTISYDSITNIGVTGIAMSNRKDFVLYKSVVLNCGSNGVMLNYKNDHAIVANCTIGNIAMIQADYFRDMTYSGKIGFGLLDGDADSIGLYAVHNEVYNTGYMGIWFNRSNNWIYRNYVHDGLIYLDDGGLIYSFNVIGAKPGGNNTVRKNILVNGMGNIWGNPYDKYMASGIFMDDRTFPTVVDSNTIIDCREEAIQLHNAYSPNVQNNLIIRNGLYGIRLQDDWQIPNMKGTVRLLNNTIFSVNTAMAYGLYVQSGTAASTVDSLGSIDYNTYALATGATDSLGYLLDWGKNTGDFYTYNRFLQITPYDRHSTYTKTFTDYRIFYTVEKAQTFYFKGDYYKDIKGKVYKDSLTLQSCTGAILFKIPSN